MKLGVIGLGRRGLFRLEQLRQQAPSAEVVGYDPSAAARGAARGLLNVCPASQTDFWLSGPFDAILIAVPTAEQGSVLRDALGHAIPVAVESILLDAEELAGLLRDSPDSAGRLLLLATIRSANLLATAGIGELRRARFVSREYGLAGENLDGQLVGALLQLQTLLPAPTQVACLCASNAAGKADKLSVWLRDAAGRTAEIELQRDSLVSERAAWTIEGSQGTLCHQRLYRRLADGEITDEPHAPPAPLAAKPWWELLQDPQTCRESVAGAAWVSRILSAIEKAAANCAGTAIPSHHPL